jgi:regulator of protease activity HflC (stomatin/prohibitin superfamily)
MGFKLTTFVIGIGIVIFSLIIMDGFVSVGPGEAGVLFDRGRGVLSNTLREGLSLKIPFWQSASIYTVKTQEYTMSRASEEGARTGDDSIQSRSSDGQQVQVDATVLFHLEPKDAPYVRSHIGKEGDYLQIVVRPKSRAVLREIVARYNALDLVSDKRDKIILEMNKALKESFAKHKITLDEVVLRDVSFSTEFATAVEEKQIAFQKVKTAEYKKQEAEQVKLKTIIEAEGTAKAIELRGQALKNNPSVIQLEFVEKMAPDIKWGILPDGALPMIDLKSLGQ